MSLLSRTRLCGMGLLACACSVAHAELPTHQIVDLGTLGGATTQPMDLNEAGQVTGYSQTASGELRAFLYTRGRMQDLGTLGGTGSLGNALNDFGHVTGFGVTLQGQIRAFVYANGRMRDIGVAGLESAGSAINNLGFVAGYAVGSDGRNQAFAHSLGASRLLGLAGNSFGAAVNLLGDIAGTYQDQSGSHVYFMRLGARRDVTPGQVSSLYGARSLNDLGQLTGGYQKAGTTRAFLYFNGRMRDIGTLGGDYAYGMAISPLGDVTGVAARADGERHAFVYTAGAMTDLGTLGGPSSFGYAINGLKQVAGESMLASGGYHAFVTSGTRLVDLGVAIEKQQKRGYLESVAYDVDRAGRVVGRYLLPDENDPSVVRSRGFLATPILSLFDGLLSNTLSVGPGRSLSQKVGQARAAYASQNKAGTCSSLNGLTREVAAQSGKQVTTAKAQSLRTETLAIAAAIGC